MTMIRSVILAIASLLLGTQAIAAPIWTYPSAVSVTGAEKAVVSQGSCDVTSTSDCHAVNVTLGQIGSYATGGLSVMQYGAVADDNGTTGTNNLPAFNAAVAYACAHTVSGGYGYGSGPTVSVPAGKFYLGGNLNMPCGIVFQGGGIGGIGNGSTQLRFPTNTAGITWSPTAFGFIMRGFYVYSTAGTVNVLYPGIWAQTKGTIAQTTVQGFSGPCIFEDGTSSNINSWRIDDVMTSSCSHSGVLAQGADGNSGITMGLESDSNGRYGIEDNSFLGNQWFFKNMSSNTLGAYKDGGTGAGRSEFSGYTETDQPAGIMAANDLAWGNQFAGTVGGAYIHGNGFDGGGLYSEGGFGTRVASGSYNNHLALNLTANESSSLFGRFIGATAEGPIAANVGQFSLYGGPSGFLMGTNPLGFLFGTTSVGALYFGNANATGLYTNGRTTATPWSIQAWKFFLGLGNAARQIEFCSAAPTTGEYALGDTCLNNSASVGGVFGWTATTAGAVATASWAGSTAYTLSNLVLNDTGKSYVNITAGTSASSGGPTGTGTNITDGTAHWKYLPSFVFTPQYALTSLAATSSGLTMSTSRLLGRTTASSGAIEEMTVGNGLTLSAGSLTVNGAGIATAITSTSASGGVGYGTGAGGAITQATSRTTGVTLNKVTGAITLVSAAGSTSWQTFTVTNSAVAANDVVKIVQQSGTDKMMMFVTHVAAGSFDISFATISGTTTEQPVINYAVVKGAAS